MLLNCSHPIGRIDLRHEERQVLQRPERQEDVSLERRFSNVDVEGSAKGLWRRADVARRRRFSLASSTHRSTRRVVSSLDRS